MALPFHFDFEWTTLLAYGVGLLLVYLVARTLLLPMRLTLPLIANGLVGILLVSLFNLAGGYFGLYIPLNPITALVAGFLGLPGVGLIVALQYVYGVA